MRHFKFLATLVALFIGTFSVQARGAVSDEAVMDSLLARGDFRFVAQTAHTTLEGYNTVQLDTYYAVEFNGESALFSLPYFGQRYNGGKRTTDSPLDFKADIRNATKSGALTDKKGLIWKFQVRNTDQAVTFDVVMHIFDNARASIQITATSYTKIDFNGYIAPLEPPKR